MIAKTKRDLTRTTADLATDVRIEIVDKFTYQLTTYHRFRRPKIHHSIAAVHSKVSLCHFDRWLSWM